MIRYLVIFLMIWFISFFSCNTIDKNRHHSSNEDLKQQVYNSILSDKSKNDTIECSNLYLFKDKLIDLDKNIVLKNITYPKINFKTCSKYLHRFKSRISNPLYYRNRKYEIVKDKENNRYRLNFYESDSLIKSVKLPVDKPFPNAHKYSFKILLYKSDVILISEDFYTAHYVIYKYSSKGEELLKKEIEHTYTTKSESNNNHYHRYLHLKDVTASQLVFTSHVDFSDKHKTILLSMEDFSVTEYEQTANGLILDKDEAELIGFITLFNGSIFAQMFNDKNFELKLEYSSPEFEVILEDSLLYIANYHPMSSGSNLCCFDLRKNKIAWIADVEQISTCYSKYHNNVFLSKYKNKIIMEGDESHGKCLQIFDAKTGKKLAAFGDLPNVRP